MGLTNSSIGINAVDSGLKIQKQTENDKVIALAGNPNVGKSTVFNGLTGMNQHTGNWPGKTVTNAQGFCSTKNNSYVFVDLPGTYSLMAHSSEEEVARNFICFSKPDAIVVVCDATCLERNLNLCLQTIEITKNVIVCVNLMDEARKKHIKIDLDKISEKLGVPVISTVARNKKSLNKLTETLDKLSSGEIKINPIKVKYSKPVEKAVSIVELSLLNKNCKGINSRWLSLKLLDADNSLLCELENLLGEEFLLDNEITEAINSAKKILASENISVEKLKDEIVSSVVNTAEEICKDAIIFEKKQYSGIDRKIDTVLTSKKTGYPIMLALLAVIFWITITGANYPSELLSNGLFYIQDRLTDLFAYLGAPDWLHGVVVLGMYRVLAWVVSVMLPPMAIFFPLFTLLEDAGYLPRIAYNLDKPFKCCNACGKQALTMCMGFGCNAAGVVGCRIIDSPRERLLAILTNNFVPCNGRFPTLIAIITMFFIGTQGGFCSSVLSAFLLTVVILFGILMTFLMTKLLSKTVLKGVPSSFTLELPPYRRPQIGKVIIRSIFDRTLFVLGRAVAVAAPAGIVIWLMANITVDGSSILNICADFLDPFAKLLGLDGVILIAFILGFPANEIVIPIIIMAYMAQGSILEFDSLLQMKELFISHGWTVTTAVCTMLFSLLHWPCSTTLMTIKKETGSIKWSALAIVLPTLSGMLICFVCATVLNLIF